MEVALMDIFMSLKLMPMVTQLAENAIIAQRSILTMMKTTGVI
jgi:hypothetical protein